MSDRLKHGPEGITLTLSLDDTTSVSWARLGFLCKNQDKEISNDKDRKDKDRSKDLSSVPATTKKISQKQHVKKKETKQEDKTSVSWARPGFLL